MRIDMATCALCGADVVRRATRNARMVELDLLPLPRESHFAMDSDGFMHNLEQPVVSIFRLHSCPGKPYYLKKATDEADHCPHCGSILRNPPNCCETSICEWEEAMDA